MIICDLSYGVNHRLLTDAHFEHGSAKNVSGIVRLDLNVVVHLAYFVQVDCLDFFHASFDVLGLEEILHRMLVNRYFAIIFLFTQHKFAI